jgi:hypothetical protein
MCALSARTGIPVSLLEQEDDRVLVTMIDLLVPDDD